MSIELFTRVRSLRDRRITGIVIGHGIISWPLDKSYFVYLVQTEPKGSSSLGPVVAVLREDFTEVLGSVLEQENGPKP